MRPRDFANQFRGRGDEKKKAAQPRARRPRPDLPKIIVFPYGLKNKLVGEMVDLLDTLQRFVGIACTPV